MTMTLFITLAWSQSLTLEISSAGAQRPELQAELTWLGEDRVLPFLDDGRQEGDVAGDRVWVVRIEEAPPKLLPLRLFLREGEEQVMIYESVEPMHGGEETLSWVLDQSALPARAYRSAQAASVREVSWRGSLGTLTPILWLGLLLTYGAWLVEKAET